MNKLQLENYYKDNMVYDRSFQAEKKRILKNHTKQELEYMFKTLYNTSRVYGNKEDIFEEDIFEEIQRYFDNIDRSLHL